MHAIFSRRVVVVVGSSSSQRIKLLKKPTLSHPGQSQSRHFLSHVLPSPSSSATRFVPSLLSRTEKFHGFFATTLRNTNLKLKFRNLLESRVGFFGSQLKGFEFESRGFTGFQKRGWKSWINGANGVVFGLIIANAAVFTMWRVSDKRWMTQNFVLSMYSFTTGRIHKLITSSFSHVGISQFIMNMIGLCYFGTRVAKTLGPLYLLKLYFGGALGGSVIFLSKQPLMATSLKGHGVTTKNQSRPAIVMLGADGSVLAITLIDLFLYPKITTYFGLMLRVPAMAGIVVLGSEMLKMLEGKQNTISSRSSQLGGVVVAAIACARLRKGRFSY